jgi:tape measure domain-containing protein
VANALNVKIGGDISELEKALSQAVSKIKNAGKQVTSVGKTLTASITAPLTAIGVASLKTAADFETLQQSMNSLNGSVEEGTRNFRRLKEFSAGTPFQLQDLAKAQNMLQGFGLSADDAFDSLSMIGDIAAISGGSIDGIGIAFGQAAAEGRLMTQDIRQLINQGVPAIKLLASTMNVAESDVLDLASQGKISFEILQQSFRDATSEGGMFANGMEQQSKTLNGLFSTLKDNVSIAMAEIGNSIADAMNLREVIPAMIERIKGVTEWFKSLSKEAKTTMVNIVRAIALVGPSLVALGATITGIGIAISLLTSPITLVVGAIAGLVTAIIYMRDNWEAVTERMSDWGWWRNMLVDMAQFLIEYSPISLLIKQVNMLLRFLDVTEIPNVFEGIADSLEGLKVETKEYENEFGSLKDAFLNTFKEFTGIDLGNMFTPVKEGAEIAKVAVQTVSDSTGVLALNLQDYYVKTRDSARKASEEISNASMFAMSVANEFTNSFGQGMANVVVQGERLVDVLKNIGRLLASSIIQKALSVFLTGGLGGDGFFGSGGGLFGKIFGVNDALITSGGDVVKFHPDDNILAMKDFSNLNTGGMQRVEVFGSLNGQDLFISSNRGSKTYER